MNRFNKSFTIEITANMIADKMHQKLAEFANADNNKHTSKQSDDLQRKADKLVGCIIAPMCSNNNTNGLKHLYYGLFDLDVDAPLFKDTDDLICSETYYGWVHKFKNDPENDGDKIVSYERKRTPINQCRLIGFDTYRSTTKYEIEYLELNSEGVPNTRTIWVDEKSLELASDHVEEKTGE